MQDYRQIQYNNWCKRKGVYNGSYLPENPDVLTKRGWLETKGKPDKTIRNFTRKSSGQKIQYNYEGFEICSNKWHNTHYHWFDTSKKNHQFSRYGISLDKKKHEKEVHLAPLDKDYDFGNKRGK